MNFEVAAIRKWHEPLADGMAPKLRVQISGNKVNINFTVDETALRTHWE